MFVERDIGPWFEKVNSVYDMISLVGPRQAGKTTFLRHMIRDTDIKYLSFNDPIAREMFEQDINMFQDQYLSSTSTTVLDEVGYCHNAGIGLKYLVDNGNKLWITSSSETLVGKEVMSYLVGRVSILRLYQFNIFEFLRARDQRSLTERVVQRSVREHSMYGGYPKVVTTKDVELKRLILRDLVQTMILKDVVLTFSIADERALEKCLRYLANMNGNIVQYNSVTGDLNISFKTLKKYLDAFEKSYLIIPISPFFSNKNKELVKQPKIYFLDLGLRNAAVGHFPGDIDGRSFENYVLTELVKAGLQPKYWRTKSGAEVDFIIEIDGNPAPIEVKLRNRKQTVERSLRAFISDYRPGKGFVVGYDIEKGKRRIGGCEVMFCDLVELLRELTVRK